MKKFLLSLALVAAGFAGASAQTVPHDKSVGGNLVYNTDSENFGVGVFYQQHFGKPWRGEVGLDYFFKNSGVGLVQMNATAHYLFGLDKNFNIYPLAGATFLTTTGAGENISRLGLNLGCGIEYFLDHDLALKAEVKKTLAKDIDPTVFSFGVKYNF